MQILIFLLVRAIPLALAWLNKAVLIELMVVTRLPFRSRWYVHKFWYIMNRSGDIQTQDSVIQEKCAGQATKTKQVMLVQSKI